MHTSNTGPLPAKAFPCIVHRKHSIRENVWTGDCTKICNTLFMEMKTQCNLVVLLLCDEFIEIERLNF